LYKQINSNGAKVVVERCEKCGANTNKKAFLPRSSVKNWDALPLFKMISGEKCEVRGCNDTYTELHHWAPRHLFEDYEDWPTSYLCLAKHHPEWHKKTRTGIYYGNK